MDSIDSAHPGSVQYSRRVDGPAIGASSVLFYDFGLSGNTAFHPLEVPPEFNPPALAPILNEGLSRSLSAQSGLA
ncbi:MAG: hypothetical protein IPP25_16015 [Saprospiraceae bacterium]|nr:hypothetical protein [Candidatus Opimibacter skivensis]